MQNKQLNIKNVNGYTPLKSFKVNYNKNESSSIT